MKALLKPVSRSFYLTIRFLPAPLREPVGLAYLLARSTDTIADTTEISVQDRLTTLDSTRRVILGEADFSSVAARLRDFAAQQSNPDERTLIENFGHCVANLLELDAADRAEIRRVLRVIVSGQEFDLRRFGDREEVAALQTASELDDYTYRVAGCVGEFWTRLGFRKLPPFAHRSPDEMTQLGVAYGKGLQLINVLRDSGADRQAGRSYLPAKELAEAPWERVFVDWLGRAQEQIADGIEYCAALTNWRVRFGTASPALIGARTIALLRAAGGAAATRKIKVPRSEVRRIVLHAAVSSGSGENLRRLFQRMSLEVLE